MGDPRGPSADAASDAAPAAGDVVVGAVATPAALDRYTALVAALLGVRPDYASTRFDAEVAAALAANRIDGATARTLRWWQRASVREIEGYANSRSLPVVLATRSDADTRAATESDESAASWQQAQVVLPDAAILPEPNVVTDAAATEAAVVTEAAAVPEVAAEPSRPSRVITIPDPAARPDPATRRRSAKRSSRLSAKHCAPPHHR